MPPTVEYERALQQQGCWRIAGIDEAGRGCWAGPVVAAAVILAPAVIDDPQLLAGVDDSKQLSAAQRNKQILRVQAFALSIGVGIVPAFLIDAYGILPATRLAMTIALLSLHRFPDALLIDAVTLTNLALPQRALIHGDALSLSIAAASVVAKVTRDRLMQTADRAYPMYGFAQHKGYGTAIHHHALQLAGPCPLHRYTFQPVMEVMMKGDSDAG